MSFLPIDWADNSCLSRRYLYFFDKGCDAITPDVLQSLLKLIADEAAGEASLTGEVGAFHRATIAHIRSQQAKGGDTAERYTAVTV